MSYYSLEIIGIIPFKEEDAPSEISGRGRNLGNVNASFWGEEKADFSGGSVACAGDVNGDGYDDILVGASYTIYGGSGSECPTYLILGKASGWVMDTNLSNSDASFRGEDTDHHYACSIAGVGDVNGDGYDDILIGRSGNYRSGDRETDQTYLILGKASGWAMDTNLSDSDASFKREDINDDSVYLVSGAGDVNGEGYDDILIGAENNDDGGRNAGQTYLILGKASGWAMDTNLSASDASFWGEDTADYSGSSVAGAGDVNGDGYDDILIGAPHNDESIYNAGQTYLLLGKASGWTMDTSLSASDTSFLGEDYNYYSGLSITGAGDVNGDGYDDILIGAPFNGEGIIGAGQTYLILGKASGWTMDTDPFKLDENGFNSWMLYLGAFFLVLAIITVLIFVFKRSKKRNKVEQSLKDE